MGKLNQTKGAKITRDGCYNQVIVKKLEIYLKKINGGRKDKSINSESGKG